MTVPVLTCWIGQTVRLDATFTDADALTPIDVTPVTMKLTAPDGTWKTYTLNVDTELQHVSTGLYRLTVSLGLEGTWTLRAQGGSPIVAVVQGYIQVNS